LSDLVRWSAGIDEVIRGDITAAAAYITPAGGAVVTAVAPCGITRQDQGTVGFTTSLGFGKKLERIIADPRVALAYHAREHGFSASSAYVLAQGCASVDLTPSHERLEALTPQVERYLGKVMHGPVWDRLLREYYQERVLVDIKVTRMAAWPDLGAAGAVEVTGAAWPSGWPAPQQPPKNGTGPRVDVAKATGRVAILPHHVLAYRGAGGFPVIVPVHVAGYDAQGMRLVAPAGLLPPGGRRAGLLAHAYREHLIGLTNRVFTGWLEAGDNGAVYAPHTSKGFVAPPMKKMLLVSNGLLAKYGLWQARRQGLAERLDRLAHTPSAPASPGTAAPPG
jgi:hypothetical protein